MTTTALIKLPACLYKEVREVFTYFISFLSCFTFAFFVNTVRMIEFITNIPTSGWRVKMISIPASMTVTQLAEIINLPNRRINLSNVEENSTHYVWIDDFTSEKEATKFARQWSDSSIFGETIKCIVAAPLNGDSAGALHSSFELLEPVIDTVPKTQRQSRFDKEAKRRKDGSEIANRSVSLKLGHMDRLSNNPARNSSSHPFHESLNRQQHVTPNQVLRQKETFSKLFFAQN
jgi:hypothetical protein